ncbi:hypothetical protein GCM10017044_02060 [Kordiimonas sediminis]|uniref:Uncharacterized protein n=1 Tax=Kordiimonas sediminis TaxID=1735581 RepID=A0A919AKE2_9PROT|nr:hypothetical protein [Kordiimonas sediminis]GHF11800.1 hypothetical protein GCM10017044_02060 [Kordiimonas sediminis]
MASHDKKQDLSIIFLELWSKNLQAFGRDQQEMTPERLEEMLQQMVQHTLQQSGSGRKGDTSDG